MSIELPWPPSVNHYYRKHRGGVYIAEAGKKYRKLVQQLVMLTKHRKLGASRIRMVINAWPPDRRRRDLDNTLKATIDSLEYAGVFDDDSQIDDLRIIRHAPDKPGRITVAISELER